MLDRNDTDLHLSDVNGSRQMDDELFELTWNEILYEGGLATWVPRSSFRWLAISICLIGVVSKYSLTQIDLFSLEQRCFSLGNILAVGTLLRQRMRKLTTYTYLTALCLSNTITLISVIVFEVDLFVKPDHFNCLTVSFAKAMASSTFALSTW